MYVGETLVTVRFSAGSYTLAESIGTTTDEIILVAETVPGVPAPAGSVGVLVSTEVGTAGVGDYHLAHAMFLFGSTPGFPWTAVGDVYRSEIPVPLAVVDDGLVEGAETLHLTVNRAPGVAGTVGVVPADSTAPPCDASGCNADVTIVDNDSRGVTVSETGMLLVDEGATAAYTVVLDSEPTGDVTVTPEVQGATDADISVSEALTFTAQNWYVPQTVIVTAGSDDNRISGSATITHTVTGGDYEANGVTAAPVPVAEADFEGRTVVSLVRVPDGTTVRDGSTVADGTTFAESDRARFRILMSAADGGPLVGGADVELSFDWDPSPRSGQISRIVLSLPRVDVWDGAVQIRDDDIANADGTVTARITGCERNGCLVGAPSEITLTIADDDGGPAAAPPGGLMRSGSCARPPRRASSRPDSRPGGRPRPMRAARRSTTTSCATGTGNTSTGRSSTASGRPRSTTAPQPRRPSLILMPTPPTACRCEPSTPADRDRGRWRPPGEQASPSPSAGYWPGSSADGRRFGSVSAVDRPDGLKGIGAAGHESVMRLRLPSPWARRMSHARLRALGGR